MNYVIRPCRTLGELAGCVTLQKRIWDYPDRKLYPPRLFVNLAKTGGRVLGAFAPDGGIADFVTGVPAWRGRRRYYWLLSLGVFPEHENRGLGRVLKPEQLRGVPRQGVEWIQWTFDSLQAKNAFLNIVRSGAIARQYLPDHYGRVVSRLRRRRPTDRLVAEWWLKSPRAPGEAGTGSKKGSRGGGYHSPRCRLLDEIASCGGSCR